MKRILLFFLLSSLSLLSASSYEEANKAAQSAFEELECEFGRCAKNKAFSSVSSPQTQGRSYLQTGAPSELHKNRPHQELIAPGITYNRAFFDLFPANMAPVLSYIAYDPHNSFDAEYFIKQVGHIKERNLKSIIRGRIEIPKDIKSRKVYIYCGNSYNVQSPSGSKHIYYNAGKLPQQGKYVLAEVYSQSDGKRYVEYTIVITLKTPWQLESSSELLPNTFFFKIAPQQSGFEHSFQTAKVYILEE